MRSRAIAAACAIMLVAAPALAYRLMLRGQPVAVAASGLFVVPAIDWSRTRSPPGLHAESWTLDGISLNDVTFFGGILDRQAMFREVDRRNRPLPRFSASMLPTDVVQLFENSFRIVGDTSLFTVTGVSPARFAGRRGFRFAYSFVRRDEEVRRLGEGTGAVIDGRLYLITYQAPAIHYFATNLGDYRAIVASARVVAE